MKDGVATKSLNDLENGSHLFMMNLIRKRSWQRYGILLCLWFALLPPGCGTASHKNVKAVKNGLIFEYDPRTQLLTVELEDQDGRDLIALPNHITRMGFLKHDGHVLRLDGTEKHGDSEKEMWGWYPSDIVVLRSEIRVQYPVNAPSNTEIHFVVDAGEYSEEAKQVYGNQGVDLWSGEVILKQ